MSLISCYLIFLSTKIESHASCPIDTPPQMSFNLFIIIIIIVILLSSPTFGPIIAITLLY